MVYTPPKKVLPERPVCRGILPVCTSVRSCNPKRVRMLFQTLVVLIRLYKSTSTFVTIIQKPLTVFIPAADNFFGELASGTSRSSVYWLISQWGYFDCLLTYFVIHCYFYGHVFEIKNTLVKYSIGSESQKDTILILQNCKHLTLVTVIILKRC